MALPKALIAAFLMMGVDPSDIRTSVSFGITTGRYDLIYYSSMLSKNTSVAIRAFSATFGLKSAK